MDKDLQQYYDDLDVTFGTRGWKSIVEDAQKMIYQFQADALDAQSWEAVVEMRGAAKMLAWLINFEAASDQNRASLEEDNTVEED